MDTLYDVSFIVPAYNMELFLDDAIQGILNQTNITFEIIIINDGSTDQTGVIANQYAAAHSMIRVIERENGGISSARNEGIEAAQGEYICFLDSDDFYSMDFAGEFYGKCKAHNLDIIRGLYRIYDNTTKKYRLHEKPGIDYYDIPLSGGEFLKKSIQQHANEVVPWLGFFKREYLLKNNLRFPTGIAYEEDQLFFLKSLLCDPDCNVMQVETEFYSYRYRRDSVTKTPTLKQAQDVRDVVVLEHEFIEKNVLDSSVKVAAYRYSCSSLFQLTSIYGRVNRTAQKEIRKMVSKKSAIRCLKYPYDTHQFLKILLFIFAPAVVDIVYRMKLRR